MAQVDTEVQTADAMVRIAREQIEAFNSGEWERMESGLASGSSYEEYGTRRTIDGPEKIVELFKGWKQAFPDAAGTITAAVASGDKAALEVTWNGTQTGPLVTAAGTIPASGKRQKTPAALFFAFTGDKITECRHYFDSQTLLEQIGA
jgi:steroid delta-isomerase-like uncharacterized protein